MKSKPNLMTEDSSGVYWCRHMRVMYDLQDSPASNMVSVLWHEPQKIPAASACIGKRCPSFESVGKRPVVYYDDKGKAGIEMVEMFVCAARG